MKNIPNVITILRILLSLILFFLKPLTPLFLIVYSICGISDIMDGYIARRTNSISSFGSVLDSIADIIFMFAAGAALLPVLFIPVAVLKWIVLIAFVKIASLLVVYFKYHTFTMLHTYANKATGLFLFCCPYLLNFAHINILGSAACIMASIAALEELIINITSKKLSRNIPWIFESHE